MKKINKKIIAGITAAVIIIIIAACILIFHVFKDEQAVNQNDENNLGNGIYIEASEPYTGEFWEDGSGTNVENIWSLKVINASEKDIQYLKIHAKAGGAEGDFEITTLPAGKELVVLESSAAGYPEESGDISYDISNLAFFQHELSVMEDRVTLYGQDNWLKLENTGDQDISDSVFVYYKNIKDGILQGGITYRAVFSGGIPVGESREQEVMHYMQDASQVMYVECGQE